MSWDAPDDYDPTKVAESPRRHKKADPRDLETIVTLLEIAAIDLTPLNPQPFTKEELYERAFDYYGEDLGVRRSDADIVLPFIKFLQKLPDGKYLLK